MTNGRKNVEIESQAVGKAPHQGVQPSGLVPAAFKTTTTTTTKHLTIKLLENPSKLIPASNS